MTDADVTVQPEPPALLRDRLIYALRQAALLGVALLIAGLVTERLRPLDVIDRGLASTTFLWAIVAWFIVLIFNSVAFERSQMGVLERTPLVGAVVVSAVVFLIGLVSLDGNVGRRLIYSLANSVGALMFWWAVFSIVALMWQRLSSTD